MVSLSNHVAISLRLSTCRGTIIATATRLPPPYQVRGRNDMRKTERPCHDRQENGARTSRFQLWEVTDAPVKEILDAALGVRVIVRKQREVWRKDNVVFNLDTVEEVGQVFEVEAQARDNWDPDQQVQEVPAALRPVSGPGHCWLQ